MTKTLLRFGWTIGAALWQFTLLGFIFRIVVGVVTGVLSLSVCVLILYLGWSWWQGPHTEIARQQIRARDTPPEAFGRFAPPPTPHTPLEAQIFLTAERTLIEGPAIPPPPPQPWHLVQTITPRDPYVSVHPTFQPFVTREACEHRRAERIDGIHRQINLQGVGETKVKTANGFSEQILFTQMRRTFSYSCVLDRTEEPS